MSIEPDVVTSDQFSSVARVTTVLGFGLLGLILISLGLWIVGIACLLIAGACLLNRHRTTIDFKSRTITDERGLIGLSHFSPLSFDDVKCVEIASEDVSTRYSSYRNYKALLIYQHVSRSSFALKVSTELHDVVIAAKEFSARSGIPLVLSDDLRKLKSELDGLGAVKSTDGE